MPHSLRRRGNGQVRRNDMLNDPRIGAIVFYVKDIKRSETFYRDVLGLQTQLNKGHGDGYADAREDWMIARAGDTSLIFFVRDEPIGRSPIVVFSLKQGGIDAIVQQLATRGVKIVTPVSEAP